MNPISIEEAVRQNLKTYFEDLGSEAPHDMYNMVLRAVERPLLQLVMQRADQNQSRAADWLGINRNTLRKKLQEHHML